jgi:hypothetical protein
VRLRLLSVGLLVTATALVCALPATAKDGVKATLTGDLPLDAEPGTRIKVAWTLAYVDDGRRRLFGAGGVFVRLASTSGASAETAYAREDSGHYWATVVVPEGRIADVEIGLRGWVSGHIERRPSDLLFPITNDPMPGVSRIASPPPDQRDSEGTESSNRPRVLPVVAGSLLAVGAAFVVLVRRKPRRRSSVQAGVRPGQETRASESQKPRRPCVREYLARASSQSGLGV